MMVDRVGRPPPDHPKAENKPPKRLLDPSKVPAVEPVALKAVPPADAPEGTQIQVVGYAQSLLDAKEVQG